MNEIMTEDVKGGKQTSEEEDDRKKSCTIM